MTIASLTGTDTRLRDAVVRELEWDPEVDASAVGVTAKDGAVTLTGFVDTYAGKLAVERIAKRVRGTRAVANDVVVRLAVDRTDPDIAHDAIRMLRLWPSSSDAVQATVHHGHLTLTGAVDWLYQKQQAHDLVRHIRGVRGVHNHITVTPKAEPRDVRRRITRALHEHADLDARHIAVDVRGRVASLTGEVGSWAQRDAAERAAASAPGIAEVDNRLGIVPQSLEPVDDLC